MPAPRRRMPRELFETRSHSWHAVGLGEELEAGSTKRALGGLLIALALIAGTMLVYYQRREWLPGYATWVEAGTATVLVVVGSVAVHWLVRVVSPRLFRRLDPATAGTLGFLVRLFAMSVVVILALRVAGITASTLALGGTITAVVLGLAAQQSMRDGTLTVRIGGAGPRCTVALRGELDMANAGTFAAALERVEGSGATRIEVDMRELEFIDSTGIAVLVSAHRRLNGDGAARSRSSRARRAPCAG